MRTQPRATDASANTAASAAAPGAVPAQVPSTEAAARGAPVVIQTDVVKVAIDPEGEERAAPRRAIRRE